MLLGMKLKDEIMRKSYPVILMIAAAMVVGCSSTGQSTTQIATKLHQETKHHIDIK